MNFFNRTMFFLHRLSGTIVALFFAMWFLTGLVLIYHPYPRVDDRMKQAHLEAIPDTLPAIEPFLNKIDGTVKHISVHQQLGQTLIELSTSDKDYTFCADTTQQQKAITEEALMQIASRWVEGTPVRKDTIYDREQWVLYERFKSEMPMVHLTYDDPDKSELFISINTGEVHQWTTRKSRFWAYIGAIPHKLYFPFIRKDLDTWKWCIYIGGFTCLIAALTGLYVGIYVLVRRRLKKKVWENPYKKFVYRWHEFIGLGMGLFMILWGFSGMFIMERIPQWIAPYEGDYTISASRFWGRRPLPLNAYKLDYTQLAEVYKDIKAVDWTHFGSVPVYAVVNADSMVYIDASKSTPEPVEVSPDEILKCAIKVISQGKSEGGSAHGHATHMTRTSLSEKEKADTVSPSRKETPAPKIEKSDCSIELLTAYDEYYSDRDNEYPLPVYKVDINNADGSRFYVSPHTGEVRYSNHNRRVKRWAVTAIHYLKIQALMEHKVLWTICIWTLCLGGAFVSLTGAWLGLKWIKRSIKT